MVKNSIGKFNPFMWVALIVLSALALTGCGTGNGATTGSNGPSTQATLVAVPTTAPTTMPTAAQDMATLTPPISGGASSTPGSGGSSVDIQVTQFTVSANFEIRGQFNATNNGSVLMQNLVPTRLVLKRSSGGGAGEVVYDATGSNVLVSIMDMKPMAGIPPGLTRTYSLTATLGANSKQVAQGDEVVGTLTLSADGKEVQVPLPSTKVSSIRIP